MSTKFFNNTVNNTLFDKLSGIANGMGENFHTFLAVSGFFRSSGYFKLREKLGAVKKIQILVGINIDNIFRKHDKALLFLGNDEKVKQTYANGFVEDVKAAKYSAEVENGILQLLRDVADGRLEMRIHTGKNLHAKFYLCLPENHTPHSDGWVIMGSSNLTDAGLGITSAPQYELNVAMKDFADVSYCHDEFIKLWKDSRPLSSEDIASAINKTHLGEKQPTPFEIYMKVLIDTFGQQIEDDFSLALPDQFIDLKYQRDAVIQGYQMLCNHNGFFLADVVGLGKTVVAAMIAKRFVEANGRHTNILVIYPPSVEGNWKETFSKFDLSRKTQFVSNGSLAKILDNKENYKPKEDFDLVIVDESHNFRNDETQRFVQLQRICKAPRANYPAIGDTAGERKKIMLLSATAFNNTPEDLLNQILLFQDEHRCNIDNVPDLQDFFAPQIQKFKEEKSKFKDPQAQRSEIISAIDAINKEIRVGVLEKITIRRTRQNILREPEYAADLQKANIHFPKVSPPVALKYKLNKNLEILLSETLYRLTGEEYYLRLLKEKDPNITFSKKTISFARYRAIEFLLPPHNEKFPHKEQSAKNLQDIYRILMVKRLESSFFAFKRSLETFIRITDNMLKMFAANKILIVPELDIKKLFEKEQEQGIEIDNIIDIVEERLKRETTEFVYPADAFDDELKENLESDKSILEELKEKWNAITEDPKLEVFIQALEKQLFSREKNPEGKLVVFSESLDTVTYLSEQLSKRLNRNDILAVSSVNRNQLRDTIKTCFDANIETTMESAEKNILISTDVLAEGINLHRSNIIVNYDTPWNISRLMQRIGRVNRIGTKATEIHNYTFYPSEQGNDAIGLYGNALAKMQSFHSALGEDEQVFSHEEIVKQFKLFDREVKDNVDKTLAFLREAREFYTHNREHYERIKKLPLKSRVIRAAGNANSPHNGTVAFIKSPLKTQYFTVIQNKPLSVDFLTAADIFKAAISEKALPFTDPAKTHHFSDVRSALDIFENGKIPTSEGDDDLTGNISSATLKDKNSAAALKFLRQCSRWTSNGNFAPATLAYCAELSKLVSNGVYKKLPGELAKIAKALAKEHGANTDSPPPKERCREIEKNLEKLYSQFSSTRKITPANDDETNSLIVVSETFA